MSAILRLSCIVVVVISYSILLTTANKGGNEHLGYGVRSFLTNILKDPIGGIKKIISKFRTTNPTINILLKGLEFLHSGQGISGLLKTVISSLVGKLEAIYRMFVTSKRDIFEVLRLGTMDTLKEYVNSTTLESYNKVVYGIFDFMKDGVKSTKEHFLNL
ncbi:uncharacterized protein [Diabrotica undecimpunctata]|uniref:uncharacterized protein n=1 Tax=Diabrotica undecimpunctata TaxID=50387 RepID=UPI003B635546